MSHGAEVALSAAGDDAEGQLRCYHCGEVIGVYEPMIALLAGAPVRTSRAALGAERAPGTVCFHADCFPHGDAGRAAEVVT